MVEWHEKGTTDGHDNLEYCIILPGKKHGSYEYPDLLVSMDRLGCSSRVYEEGKKLGLELKNNKQGYVGNIDWEDALKLDLSLGYSTLDIRQFLDFVDLLKTGGAYTGVGKKLGYGKRRAILDDIIRKVDPTRSEYFDAYFKIDNDVLYINYEHKLKDGKLVANRSEPVDCLMKNILFGIDLDDLIKKSNHQGLPSKDVGKGNIWYWCPKDYGVARFLACSIIVGLDCDRYPWNPDSDLGIRPMRVRV